MKIVVEIELTAQEMRLVAASSLERVLKNAAKVIEEEAKEPPTVGASIAMQDLPEVTPLASRLWSTLGNAVFVASQECGHTRARHGCCADCGVRVR